MVTQEPTSRMLPKIRRTYVGSALLAFNTALLTCMLLATIHIGLNVVERCRGTTPVYKDAFDLSAFTKVDEATAREIVHEFDVHATGGHESEGIGEYDYQPWAGFAERPFSGKYLNVEERAGCTTRRTSAPDPERAGVEDFVVWAFGGSTQFGFGINDDDTVPSHLQRQLQALLPNRRVVVINHGHGWWYSTQEVVHFLTLLHNDASPQVAIFLDGFNEYYIAWSRREPYYFSSILYDGWESERQRRRYPAPRGAWFQLTPSFPTNRIQRFIRPLESAPPPVPPRFEKVANDPARRLIEVYMTNRRIAVAAGDALGIQVHFFLQPVSAGWRSTPILTEAYDELILEAAAGPTSHLVSLHGVLDGLEQAYVDGIHYNEEGARVLATHMAEQIVKEADHQRR